MLGQPCMKALWIGGRGLPTMGWKALSGVFFRLNSGFAIAVTGLLGTFPGPGPHPAVCMSMSVGPVCSVPPLQS